MEFDPALFSYHVVLTIRNVRPARNSNNDNVKADVVDDDKGELEKSNILLMGPTMLGK